MEFNTAQLRIRAKCIIAEGSEGAIIWVTPSRARMLIDAGAAELVNPGPSETKPTGAAEKKYSAAGPAGRSTATARSIAPGAAALSSASAGDLVQPQRRRKSRKARAEPQDLLSGSSQ